MINYINVINTEVQVVLNLLIIWLAKIEILQSKFKLKNTDTAITTMPMSYTYGLSIISSHLSIGKSCCN